MIHLHDSENNSLPTGYFGKHKRAEEDDGVEDTAKEMEDKKIRCSQCF